MKVNRQMAATMRRLDEVAERIRSHREAARMNVEYRKTLAALRLTIDVALARVDAKAVYGEAGWEINDLERLYAAPAHGGPR